MTKMYEIDGHFFNCNIISYVQINTSNNKISLVIRCIGKAIAYKKIYTNLAQPKAALADLAAYFSDFIYIPSLNVLLNPAAIEFIDIGEKQNKIIISLANGGSIYIDTSRFEHDHDKWLSKLSKVITYTEGRVKMNRYMQYDQLEFVAADQLNDRILYKKVLNPSLIDQLMADSNMLKIPYGDTTCFVNRKYITEFYLNPHSNFITVITKATQYYIPHCHAAWMILVGFHHDG